MPPPPVMVTMVMMKTTLIIIVHPVVTIQLWRHPFHDEHISVPTQGLFLCLELQKLGKEAGHLIRMVVVPWSNHCHKYRVVV